MSTTQIIRFNLIFSGLTKNIALENNGRKRLSLVSPKYSNIIFCFSKNYIFFTNIINGGGRHKRQNKIRKL